MEHRQTASMDWQRVRAELTALRLEQRPKMSQTRLGKAAGFSKSTVHRIENVYVAMAARYAAGAMQDVDRAAADLAGKTLSHVPDLTNNTPEQK